MINYDISIMKNNIKSIMEKKNIKQTQLAAATGISQPQISSVLNTKNSNSFTIGQLVSIADYLGCSVDEILGLNINEKRKEIESLSDILSMIFEIDANAGIKIGVCGTGEMERAFDSDIEEIKTSCLYLNIPVMETILTEWNDLKKSSIKEPLKSKIIKQWEESILQEYENYRKEWDFRSELEQCEYLAGLALRQYFKNDPLPQTLSLELSDRKNQKMLYEYINDLDPASEYTKKHYDCADLELLGRYKESYLNFIVLPDGSIVNAPPGLD